MIRITRLNEAWILRDNPELWREVYGYMAACTAEIIEYADEEDLDEDGFTFLVASEAGDLDYIQSLGTPEERVDIEVSSGSEKRRLQRLVFTSEVIFIDRDNPLPTTMDNHA
jgi:hypothetical protein